MRRRREKLHSDRRNYKVAAEIIIYHNNAIQKPSMEIQQLAQIRFFPFHLAMTRQKGVFI